jgi:hypothetical protein
MVKAADAVSVSEAGMFLKDTLRFSSVQPDRSNVSIRKNIPTQSSLNLSPWMDPGFVITPPP